MTVFVADISSYQRGLTVARLKAAGFSAVILKATEGTGWTDPCFAGWLAEARALGFPVSAYHFAKQGNGDAQAVHVRAVVPADVPVWMDCEAGATRNDGYAVAAGVRQRGGLVAGIYHGAQPAAGYGWWRAAYLSNPTGGPSATYAVLGGDHGLPWVGEDLWQYTSRCRISGYSGDLDSSAYRGTLDQLLAHGWFAHRSIEPATIFKGDSMLIVSSGGGYRLMWPAGNAIQFTSALDVGIAKAAVAAGFPSVTLDPSVFTALCHVAPAYPTPEPTPAVDVAALTAGLAGPLAAAVAADLPGSPAGTLTPADVEAAVRAVLHGA